MELDEQTEDFFLLFTILKDDLGEDLAQKLKVFILFH